MKKFVFILGISIFMFSCSKEDNPISNSLTDADLVLASEKSSFGKLCH